MRGHGGSNVLAGDTHVGENKAREGKRRENKMKNLYGRSDTQTKQNKNDWWLYSWGNLVCPFLVRVTRVYFLSHPVVEGMLRAGHSTEIRTIRLRRQWSGEGNCGRAGDGGLAIHRLRTRSCVLQGQRGIGHPCQVYLFPRCTHI